MSFIDDMRPRVFVNGERFDALRVMAERYPDIRWVGPYCAEFTDEDGRMRRMYLPELIHTGREIAKWNDTHSRTKRR